MRIFVCCLLCLLLLFVLVEFFPRAPVRPEAVVVSESPSAAAPYDRGYARGRASFLRQMGEDVPMPPAARYTASDHESSEEELRGYVDGYHRAADLMYCPRER